MDGDIHGRQTLEMALEMVANEMIYNDAICCIPGCDNIGEAAFKLSYLVTGGHDLEAHETNWISFCEECQGGPALAPYWWNKALRGESLEDEDE